MTKLEQAAREALSILSCRVAALLATEEYNEARIELRNAILLLRDAIEALAEQEETVTSVFLQNLHYFFGQNDGTYKWPDGSIGDLLRQAKREIEQQEKPEPVAVPPYLLNGTRFKVSSDGGQAGLIFGIPHEIVGAWVAFVAADDGCHLKPPRREWAGLTHQDMYMAIRSLYANDELAWLAVQSSSDEYFAIFEKTKELNR